MKTKVIGFRVDLDTFKKYQWLSKKRNVSILLRDAIDEEVTKTEMFEEFLKDINSTEKEATEIYEKLKGIGK